MTCAVVQDETKIQTERIELPTSAVLKPRHNRLDHVCTQNYIQVGREGHRSPCLVHAKHALYHLSYTPEKICVVVQRKDVEERGIDPLASRMLSARSAI